MRDERERRTHGFCDEGGEVLAVHEEGADRHGLFLLLVARAVLGELARALVVVVGVAVGGGPGRGLGVVCALEVGEVALDAAGDILRVGEDRGGLGGAGGCVGATRSASGEEGGGGGEEGEREEDARCLRSFLPVPSMTLWVAAASGAELSGGRTRAWFVVVVVVSSSSSLALHPHLSTTTVSSS